MLQFLDATKAMKDEGGPVDYWYLQILYFYQYKQQIVVIKSHFVFPIALMVEI